MPVMSEMTIDVTPLYLWDVLTAFKLSGTYLDWVLLAKTQESLSTVLCCVTD